MNGFNSMEEIDGELADCLNCEMFIAKLKQVLLDLPPRTFGTVGEMILKKYLENKGLIVTKSDSIHYDKNVDGETTEDKASRIKKSQKFNSNCENLYEELLSYEKSRFLKESELNDFDWDCNIQQVKFKFFKNLYYMLFCDDKIFIFKITPEELKNDTKVAYSDKQHAGNVGEGQFHIKKNNFKHHKEKYLLETLTWVDLDKLLKNNKNKKN